MIDMEHGASIWKTIADLAGWFAATNVSPIVRIHKAFIHQYSLMLDQGNHGHTDLGCGQRGGSRARSCAKPSTHPREPRMSGDGTHTGYQSYGNRYQTEYAPWANENVILCPSIESLEGLKNVAAIAAVEGIDMIAYGHSDLSGALGIHLQLDHPRFKEVRAHHSGDLRKHGKLARGSAETEAQIEEYWKLGCKVLNLPGTDTSTYLDGLKARAERAHARLKSIGVPTPEAQDESCQRRARAVSRQRAIRSFTDETFRTRSSISSGPPAITGPPLQYPAWHFIVIRAGR